MAGPGLEVSRAPTGHLDVMERAPRILGGAARSGLLVYALGAEITWPRFAPSAFNAEEALIGPVRRDPPVSAALRCKHPVVRYTSGRTE
jgi:hypothetical protein